MADVVAMFGTLTTTTGFITCCPRTCPDGNREGEITGICENCLSSGEVANMLFNCVWVSPADPSCIPGDITVIGETICVSGLIWASDISGTVVNCPETVVVTVAELGVAESDVCGMVWAINGKKGADSKFDARNGLTCKPAARGELGTFLDDCDIFSNGALFVVVTIATLRVVGASLLTVVIGVAAVFVETSAAKVGAVSDVTKIGCANLGSVAM